MSSYVFQCVGLTGGTVDNLDAMDPSAFTGKEIAITITDPTSDQRKFYMHQAVNSGAVADGVNIVAPVVTSTWRWHILPRPLSKGIFIVEDQELSGVPAGDSLAGDNTRVLNTVVYNGITGANLDAISYMVTLPAGTFLFEASAPAREVDEHQVYLYDVTGAAEIARGESMFAKTTYNVNNRSAVKTIVTITATNAFLLKHYTAWPTAGYGLGSAVGQGTEVYARMSIYQLE